MVLSPLFSDKPSEQPSALSVPIDHIEPNPQQPRHFFNAQSLEKLAHSIQQQGIIQPLVVRKHPSQNNKYQLIAGERRWQAMNLLHWKRVPVVIRAISDQQLLEVALVENLQREPLTAIEEAEAYRHLLALNQETHQDLAARLGRDRSTITNMLRLLSLPHAVQHWLEDGDLTIGHARAILAIPHADQQVALGRWVVDRHLSVRETERLAQRQKKPTHPSSQHLNSTTGHPVSEDDEITQQAIQALERIFRTRVQIEQETPKSSGAIRIEFNGEADLQRICDVCLKPDLTKI